MRGERRASIGEPLAASSGREGGRRASGLHRVHMWHPLATKRPSANTRAHACTPEPRRDARALPVDGRRVFARALYLYLLLLILTFGYLQGYSVHTVDTQKSMSRELSTQHTQTPASTSSNASFQPSEPFKSPIKQSRGDVSKLVSWRRQCEDAGGARWRLCGDGPSKIGNVGGCGRRADGVHLSSAFARPLRRPRRVEMSLRARRVWQHVGRVSSRLVLSRLVMLSLHETVVD